MDTLELVAPYVAIAIPIVLGVMLCVTAIAMRNSNKCLQKAVDENDAEIKEGFKKMKTLVQFATSGYRVSAGETVSHVGDGYIVTSDQNGAPTINMGNRGTESEHELELEPELELELYKLKIKMIEYDMRARAYLAMYSAMAAQEDITKTIH